MNTPLVGNQVDVAALAARFRAMADLLEANKGQPFGGAVVVIPPAGMGDPIEFFMMDNKQDGAQFWGLLKTKSMIAIAEIEQQQMRAQGVYRR